MGELYNRINELCQKQHITIAEMCRRSGVPQQNITEIKKGRQQGLSAKNLDKIANYFGVTASYLLGTEKENPVQLDGAESELIERVRSLPPEKQETLRVFLQTLESMP